MTRHCARPGCSAAADAAFNFDGLRRIVWLNALTDPRAHSAGDLCRQHADGLRPPLHWELRDLRRAQATAAVLAEPATPLLARAFRAAG